jgi:hypothetical protein
MLESMILKGFPYRFHQLSGAECERYQDSASAPTPRPHSPCPYSRDIWHLIVGRTTPIYPKVKSSLIGYY